MKYKSDVTAIRAFPCRTNSICSSPQYIFSGLRLLRAKHRITQLEHWVPNQQRPDWIIDDNARSQSLNPAGVRQSCDSEYMISKAAPNNPLLSSALDRLPCPHANSTKCNWPTAFDSWFAMALSQMVKILSSSRTLAIWGNAASRIFGHHTDACPWWNCRSNDRKARILNAICLRRPMLLHLLCGNRLKNLNTKTTIKLSTIKIKFQPAVVDCCYNSPETSLTNDANSAKLANNRCEIRWNFLSFSTLAVSMEKPQRRCWWWFSNHRFSSNHRFRFSRNHWSMRFIILLLHMILLHLGLDIKLAIRSVARHGARSCCHKRKHHHHHIVMRCLCNCRFALAMKLHHGDNDVESITRNYFCRYHIILMSVDGHHWSSISTWLVANYINFGKSRLWLSLFDVIMLVQRKFNRIIDMIVA